MSSQDQESGVTPSAKSAGEAVESFPAAAITSQEIAVHCGNIFSDDVGMQLLSTQYFRRLILSTNAIEELSPARDMIKAGVVPRFVEFLSSCEHPQLQLEATWALARIVSLTSERVTISDSGVTAGSVVPLFIRLLESTDNEVREKAVWALGDLAVDSKSLRRDRVFLAAIPALLRISHESSPLSTIQNVTLTLSNLCSGKPPLEGTLVESILPYLARSLSSTDSDTVLHACNAFSHIASPHDIQIILDSGVVPRLMKLLASDSLAIQAAALRTVASVAMGSDEQTQFILNLNVLPVLRSLLESPQPEIQKDICWMVSNIAAGTARQTKAVFDCGILPKIISLLSSPNPDVQKEATWAVVNAITNGTQNHVEYMIRQGAVRHLSQLLRNPNENIRFLALEGMETLLLQTDRPDEVVNIICDSDGVQAIEDLATNVDKMVSDRAENILDRYLHPEDDADESDEIPRLEGHE